MKWESLGRLVEEAAGKFGEKTLFIFENERLSFAGANRLANKTANALRSLGIAKGDRVAVMLPNITTFPVVWFALAKLGAVLVPVNINYKEHDLTYTLNDSESRFFVVYEKYLEQWEQVRANVPSVEQTLVVTESGQKSDWMRRVEESSDAFEIVNVTEEDLLNIQYTSGTTGFPKGCMLTHKYWMRLAQEVAKPAPQDDEVLIRIYAASVNARDWRFMRAKPFFIRLMPGGFLQPKNKILGADVAGRVEAIGRYVKQFKPGDEVFGYLPSATGRGTFTEYVCAQENLITLKPANLTFEQAAAVPLAAMTALHGLRDNGNIQQGQKVLIQGASGGVGTFAVQIAKAFGAEVTGVCSTRNLEMVHSIGADHVIDYKKEDFTQNGQKYDLILAVNGYHPISDYLRALIPEGIYVIAGGSMLQLFQAALQGRRTSKTGSKKTYVVSLEQSQKDLIFMKELLESGKVMPVIDGCYPLSKTAEAFWYFEKVHPKGKVVISVV